MSWSVVVSRAYRTPRCNHRVEHPQSWPRSPGSRTHTISSPTADNHQSYPTDAEFHASLEPWYPVQANVLLAFPLTRLRLSACLHRSPSISRVESSVRLQLHLQHDSLVEDQSTLCPVDFMVSCVAVLNQPRAIACRSTHPSGMRHVFPCHRIRIASALTLLRRCRRSSPSSVSVRLSSPTQPNVSTAIMLHLVPPNINVHCLAPFGT
jgi:hypothetical protein